MATPGFGFDLTQYGPASLPNMQGIANPWGGQATAAAAAPAAGAGFPLVGTAIGAGLGILNSIDQAQKYQAQMGAKEATTRYSPWTHLTMANPQAPNIAGNILGYGASGATLQQALTKKNKNSDDDSESS